MSWLKALLGFFGPLVRWFQQRQLIKAGKDQRDAENLRKQAEISRRQAEAAANAPDTPDELADRLRDPDSRF